MSTRTTWRWSSLLVVVTMIVSMAAATVSASPGAGAARNRHGRPGPATPAAGGDQTAFAGATPCPG
jgi:hypothetical protein